MRAELLEKKILAFEEHLELEKKYNFILDRIFLIIYPILALILFRYFWNENKSEYESYIQVLELIVYVLVLLFATFLLSNSRPVKKFIMEWGLLKRLAELDTSKLSREEILKLCAAIIINVAIIIVTIFTQIIPEPYTLVLIVYLGVYLLSFLPTLLLSFIIQKLYKIKLQLFVRIRDKWKPTVLSIIGLTALIVWLIGALVL